MSTRVLRIFQRPQISDALGPGWLLRRAEPRDAPGSLRPPSSPGKGFPQGRRRSQGREHGSKD